jgi:site-specific recombinase XerD
MGINDFLKKIAIKNLDCKGIYFKDIGNIFKNKKELDKKDLQKIDYENIDIVLKFYFRKKIIVKSLKYHNITGLNAVKKASITRSELKEELESSGTLKKASFKSLDELKDNYFIFKGKSLSEKNTYNQKKTYDKWIQSQLGDMEVSKILTTDIQSIVNDILKQGKAPRTAQSIVQILRPIFNYAIDIGLCEINPAIKVNLPKFDNTVDFQLSDEKRKRLYDEILKYEPLKYRGIMLFLYFGRRQNEVLTLKWQNIDFEHNVYTIEDIYSKIRRRQEYPLLKPLKDFLIEFGIHKTGYVFKGETTPHVTKNTFRNHWKILLENAGIEKMRIHDTRHLLGNTMVNKGQSLEAIGKVLGHSSTAVTKRYAKTSLNTANDVLNSYLED